jgi:hypothetical protein
VSSVNPLRMQLYTDRSPQATSDRVKSANGHLHLHLNPSVITSHVLGGAALLRTSCGTRADAGPPQTKNGEKVNLGGDLAFSLSPLEN